MLEATWNSTAPSVENDNDCVIVTASDSRYCDLLLGMLRSLSRVELPLVVFDLGLSEYDHERIRSACTLDCHIFDPGWCVPLEDESTTPAYKKVFLAKPFLPELIPGYAKYIWVDADICFQDDSAIDDYIAASDITGAAIGFEDHPSYKKKGLVAMLQRLNLGKKRYDLRRMEQYFGAAVAREWPKGAALNSGIFCIHGDSEIWPHWQTAMAEANLKGQRRKRLICDQTCLALAIARARLQVERMPATHNWCLGRALPMSRETPPYLVDPHPPHRPIKVMHATGNAVETEDFMSRYTTLLNSAPKLHLSID